MHPNNKEVRKKYPNTWDKFNIQHIRRAYCEGFEDGRKSDGVDKAIMKALIWGVVIGLVLGVLLS